MKPQLLLFDADVIIEAHKLNVWKGLTKAYDIFVPSIIIDDQAKFYSGKEGKITIDLRSEVKNNQIKELPTTEEEIARFKGEFSKIIMPEIHPGEIEALAYIFCHHDEGHLFCTGDHAAIVALSLCGMSDKIVSLEILLKKIGLQKNLEMQFTEKYVRDIAKKASIQRIQTKPIV